MGQYASAPPPSFLRTGRASRFGLRAEGSAAATSSAGPLRFFFFFPPEDGPAWGSEALAFLTSGRPDCMCDNHNALYIRYGFTSLNRNISFKVLRYMGITGPKDLK